jgi:hypothetical protein
VLHYLYILSSIVVVFKAQKLKCAGHVAEREKQKNVWRSDGVFLGKGPFKRLKRIN